MNQNVKDLFDVAFTFAGLVGAAIAFVKGLAEWREAQRWRRAEQLDKLIQQFEDAPLLVRARIILDYTWRRVDADDVTMTNEDVLLALRHHDVAEQFTKQQARIRDQLDAFLTFLDRLESALESHLVDVEPARKYFAYWVERFVRMDRHPWPEDEAGKRAVFTLEGETPAIRAAQYVEAYGDQRTVESICSRFGLDDTLHVAPHGEAAR